MAALGNVKSEAYRRSLNFLSWQARCFIMTRKPEAAWKLYLHLESKQTEDACGLLHIIANECYGMGQFLYSCKAFQACPHIQRAPSVVVFSLTIVASACFGNLLLKTVPLMLHAFTRSLVLSDFKVREEDCRI